MIKRLINTIRLIVLVLIIHYIYSNRDYNFGYFDSIGYSWNNDYIIE